MTKSQPQLIIVAGANGSGKSTLTKHWATTLAGRLGPVLDPDAIACELNPNEPAQASIQAARTVLNSITKFLNDGLGFVIETTLSDRKRHLDLIDRAHAQTFRVSLVYVGLERPELNLLRVATRVRAGGHNVPEADVLRRRERSLNNLPETLKRVDQGALYDNLGRSMRLVLGVQSGVVQPATAQSGETDFVEDAGWWKTALLKLNGP